MGLETPQFFGSPSYGTTVVTVFDPEAPAGSIPQSYMLLTFDGGYSWHPMLIPFSTIGARQWILSHSLCIFQAGASIHVSKNGGVTWTTVTAVSPPGGQQNAFDNGSLEFVTSTIGYFFPFSGNSIWTTTDAGKTWRRTVMEVTIGQSEGVCSVSIC